MPSFQFTPVFIRFFQLLAQIRKEKGLTINKLSEKTGVSRGTISLIERGLTNPNLTTVNKIAKSLGWKLEDLMARAEREAKGWICNRGKPKECLANKKETIYG